METSQSGPSLGDEEALFGRFESIESLRFPPEQIDRMV